MGEYNKSGELINYPAGNLLAHFKRYVCDLHGNADNKKLRGNSKWD